MRQDYFDDDNEFEIRPRRKRRSENADIMQAPKVRKHSRDVVELSMLPIDTIKYIALAVLIIVTAFCGIKFFSISAPIVLIVLVIVVLMAFLLHNAPEFASIILASVILIVGVITGTLNLVLLALVTYLGTALTFKQ